MLADLDRLEGAPIGTADSAHVVMAWHTLLEDFRQLREQIG
jgi:hypothetical protein